MKYDKEKMISECREFRVKNWEEIKALKTYFANKEIDKKSLLKGRKLFAEIFAKSLRLNSEMKKKFDNQNYKDFGNVNLDKIVL